MIYIFPGMGADSRMYSGPWLEVSDTKYLDWPQYQNENTIKEVADRVIHIHSISQFDIVAGSSLGGFVALEIAQKLGIKRVILFGSALSRKEINPLLLMLAPLTKYAPIKFTQTIAGKYRNNVLKMFSGSDENFIRAMCIAVTKWPGFVGDKSIVKRIHGEKDLVISCHSNCRTIKGGGHLIAITHARECIEMLNQSI